MQLNGETTKYTAKVVGVDEDTDLAVIKIEPGKELPVAKLGNSDGVQVGDWVLAIGSPFGLKPRLPQESSARRIAAESAISFSDSCRPMRPSTREIPADRWWTSPAK